MEDNLNHYCEVVIRSPLPILLRRAFIYAFCIVYCVVQTYACCQLSKWRLSRNQQRVNNTDIIDPLSNSTANFTSQSLNNSYSESNATDLKLTDVKIANTSVPPIPNNAFLNAEEIPPLYGHAFAVPLMMGAFLICIFACRVRYQSVYACAVQYVNLIDVKDVDLCRNLRMKYKQKDRKLNKFQEETLKAVLTMKEHNCLYVFWKTTCLFWQPTVNISSVTYPAFDCTLVDYMFSSHRYEGSFQILGAIELIYEIMKAMDYLHYRNVYHLDLRPESVKLHCNGRKVYVKLTNFNFMKKSIDKKVASSSVGLRGFYRPLECSVDQEVDAEKCDMWGLGMIALDLFTGGLYRIKSESGDWDEQRSEDLISRFTQSSSFSSYLDGTYGVVDMFTYARYNSVSAFEVRYDENRLGFAIVTEYPYKTYHVCHTNFMYNIRCFVCRLLIFSPRRRITLQRAFEEPLIKNRKLKRRK